MSARHVVPNGKSYITTEFTGKLLSDGDKRYAIYDLEHPLFNVINGGTIKNINFENVDINRSGQNQIATVGFNLKNKGLIEDVKVAGSVTGNNDVAGIVNKIDEDGKIENVALSVKSTLLVITQQLVGLLVQTTWDSSTEPMWMRPLQLKMPTQVCWCHLSLTCSTVGNQERRLR